MVRSKVINDTTRTITLKEGTTGAYSVLKKIRVNESFIVHAEETATYREFMCVVTDSNSHLGSLGSLTITSEDCVKYGEFTIREQKIGEDEDGKDKMELVLVKKGRKPGPIDGLTDDNIAKVIRGAPSWFASLFKFKKSSLSLGQGSSQGSAPDVSQSQDLPGPSKPSETA